MDTDKDVIKCREIRFTRFGVNRTNDLANIDQASKAMGLLADIDGIKEMAVTTSNVLQIRYDVRQLTLQMIESALTKVDFNLDNSITINIKRSLYAYCEEAQRSSLGLEQAKAEAASISLQGSSTPTVVGAHDPRPDNWRHYV